MYSNVGKREFRVDAKSKVTGKTIYPQDIYMDDMLYGKTLRSSKPHAYIKVDITEAEAMDGVSKVFTAKDVTGENHHGVLFKDHEVFCEKKVRRIGDPIAFVVAETAEIAEKAVEKIKVEYDELEGVFDPRKAMSEDSPQVHDGQSNATYHYKIRKGDIEDAFAKCDVVVEQEYKTGMVDHAFLQPEAGVAYMEGEKVVVAVSTQYPHFDRIEVAEALGVPEEQVRILNPAVGGAFGGREDITLQIHLALATRLLKKPIKSIYDREESFLAHSKRHAFVMKYKTGASKEGKLLATEVEIIGDTGAYASWVCNIVRKGGVHATGPYEIPNVKVDAYGVYTNNPYAGAMRGFGATQPPVAYEQQMDMIAEKLGMNPIEFRMKNIFKKGSITATGQELYDSVPAARCLEEVEKRINKNNR
jgi:nicotinate dehydrogenase large molybdopterin subunit